MTVSLFFLKKVQEKWDWRWQIALFGSAFLMVISNMTLLTLYLSLWLVYNLVLWSRQGYFQDKFTEIAQKTVRLNLIPLLFAAATALLIYKPITKLQSEDKLFYGGIHGFWEDTVESSIRSYIYTEQYPHYLPELLLAIIIMCLLLMLAMFLYKLRQDGLLSLMQQFSFQLFLLLVIPAFATVVQHYLLGTRFLIHRTALWLVPIFIFNLVNLLHFAWQKQNFRKYSAVVAAALSLAAVAHFCQVANFRYTTDWRYDAGTKFMMQDLVKLTKENDRSAKLVTSWLYHPTTTFYKEVWDADKIEIIIDHLYNTPGDYYYFHDENLDKLMHKRYPLPVIKYYEASNCYLAR